MSGLVGWIDFRRDLRSQRDVIKKMTDTMRYRGPDAGGVWVSENASLGHRQLSVIDREGGTEPLTAEIGDSSVVAVHAGRIYNATDLRSELEACGCVFKTRSDTELLLYSFLRWGSQFVERLNGMFAFAIWDGRARQLLLVRDRMGVKPLYYFEYPGGILFASEPKGIMANPVFEPRLDLSAIPILLQPRLAMPGETPLAGLREVPPAHVVTYSLAGLSQNRFWRLTSAPHEESFKETAHRVRHLLEDIVGREIAADVPGGAMLSGGVDSTSVAALAMRELRRRNPACVLDTFCVQFECDPVHFLSSELRPDVDTPYAAEAAAYLGSRHRTVTASVQDLLDVIPATRRARDLPAWGQFDASMYFLFREMRQSCKVALTGEAADEIFGGYPYFFKPEILRRSGFPWAGDGPRLSDHVSPNVRRYVDPRQDEVARYAQLISEVPRLTGEDPENARMREVFYLGLSGPLAVILDRKDRMSASQGLEVRIPFCDHRLVQYVWNIPWSLKANGGVKGLLKAAMAGVLPVATVNRRKSAYPHIQSPVYDRGLVREATLLVEDGRSPIAWMFDVGSLKRLIEELSAEERGTNGSQFPGGASPVHMLIHLIEVDHWIREFKVSIR